VFSRPSSGRGDGSPISRSNCRIRDEIGERVHGLLAEMAPES
jgi:hypothetical protein